MHMKSKSLEYTHINNIVERSMLCDWDKSGLMVCCCVDRSHSVYTRWKATGDISSKKTPLCRAVQTQEKREGVWINGFGLGQRGHCLDDDMRVADD